MGTVERLPVVEDIDTALAPLEKRIRECDSLRVGLIRKYQDMQNDPQSDPISMGLLSKFILDFETRAIDPARVYARDVREGKLNTSRIPSDLVALSTWIQEIEKTYPIDWGSDVHHAQVLPFKR